MSSRLFQVLAPVLCSLAASTVLAQVQYTTLYGNVQRNIDISRPVGVIDGTASATQNGAATYTIPIKCPPGTNGVVPGISITYNSLAGNGVLGMGWSIQGLSAITRVPKNIYHDAEVKPVENNYNDRFALDGVRLEGVSGNYGHDGSTYRLETDNFSTITSVNNVGNGPMWFRVRLKDGTIMDYGGNADSRYLTDNGSEVMIWRLNRIEDVNGNYVLFSYINDRKGLIDEIKYTGNANTGLQPYNLIKFNYAERTDKNIIYDAGSHIDLHDLLTSIQVKGENSQVFRTYEFSYGLGDVASHLKEVREKNADGVELNSTIFKYGDMITTVQVGVTDLEIPYQGNPFTGDVDIFTGDYDGDGKTDILAAAFTQAAYTNLLKYHTKLTVYRNTGGDHYQPTASWDLPQNSRIMSQPGDPNYFEFISSDFNGDGLDDILIYKTNWNGSHSVLTGADIFYAQSGAIFSQSPDITLPPPNGAAEIPYTGRFFYPGDFDGDGRTDYLSLMGVNPIEVFISFPAKNSINNSVSINPSPFNQNLNPTYSGYELATAQKVFIVDFDGDGKQEIMFTKGDITEIYRFVKNASNQFVGERIFVGGYPGIHDVWTGDFNGDRKTDILTRIGSLWEVAYSDGKEFHAQNLALAFPYSETCSWTTGSWPSQATHTVPADRIYIADYNGDGKSDILHYDLSCGGSLTAMFRLYYSTGTDFDYAVTSTAPIMSQGVRTLSDANGDGRVEISFRDSHPDNDTHLRTLYFKASHPGRLLEKVADGLGRTTTFQYKLLTDGAPFYTRGSITAHPVNNIQPGIYMLSSLSVPNGIGGQAITNYKYEEARLHRAGRGFLGFHKVIETNSTVNLKSESIFGLNTTYFQPYLSESNTYLASTNAQLSHNTYNYSFVSTGSLGFYQRLNTATEQNLLSGATTTTTNNTFDSYGNITQSTLNVNNIETTVTNTTYVTANTPVPAKPGTINITRTRTGLPAAQDGTSFTYDALGRLKKRTERYQKLFKKTTEFTYDSYGNITSEVFSGTSMPYSATKSATYDSKGRFPVSTTNPLGQVATSSWHAL